MEEAKIEVDCEEPTDERDMKNDIATKTMIDAPEEGASPAAVTHVDTDDNGGVKQIKMTVAADAPWKDRVWEGSFGHLCVCVSMNGCERSILYVW